MLKHVKGDLLDLAEAGEFDVIIQGCNCFNTMGSGIARSIKERYPQAYAADQLTESGDRTKLGTITCAEAITEKGTAFIIVNAYTQYGFNKTGESNDMFEYDAFQRVLDAFVVDGTNLRVGLPYIGMGLAGGDRARIMAMIEDFATKISAKNGQVTLVEFA